MVRFWYGRTVYRYNQNRLRHLKKNDIVERIGYITRIIEQLELPKEMHNKDINVYINTYLRDYYSLKEYLESIIDCIDKRKYIKPDKYIGFIVSMQLYRFFQKDDKAIKIKPATEEIKILLDQLEVAIIDARLSNIALMEYYYRVIPSLLTELTKVITVIGDYKWQLNQNPKNS